MTEISENHEELRQFLLGSLNEDTQQRIEVRLMTESGFLEELEAYEDELIDDYVNNTLDADSRVKFEQYFLCSPDRQLRLRFAMALDRYTSQKRYVAPVNPGWFEWLKAFWTPNTWAFRSVITIAVVAVIVFGLWILIPQTPKTFAGLNLSLSTNNRAEGAPSAKITLPLNADALRVKLTLTEQSVPAQSYRIEMMDDKGSTTRLKPESHDAHIVSVVILAEQLSRGEYALILFRIRQGGQEERINGSYFFTVQ